LEARVHWLSVSHTSGAAPDIITVFANPAGLDQGTYTGSITITPLPSAAATNGPITIPVSLAVSAPAISPGGIVDGAIFQTAVSAGSIASIFGVNLADTTASAQSTPLPTTLGGVQVLVDGIPVPLFYVSPSQINVQLPPGIVGNVPVNVVRGGRIGTTTTANLLPEAPEIFVMAGSRGAVLNQDYSLNSTLNPAPIGSVITIFATGLGNTNPPLAAGQAGLAVAPFNVTSSPVTVLINGQSVPALFSAVAPGFVGLYQVNVLIPNDSLIGVSVPLQVQINGQFSNTVVIATKR
jgi:uncharacterized protein (TIGR03437 family)